MRSVDGALPRRCSLGRSAPPMCKLFEILATHTPSVRNIEPPQPSIASMTRRIVRVGVGSSVLSLPCGALLDRLLLGTSKSPDQSRFGEPGTMMFKDAPSAPDTFSRKRLPNQPLTLSTASSAPLNSQIYN